MSGSISMPSYVTLTTVGYGERLGHRDHQSVCPAQTVPGWMVPGIIARMTDRDPPSMEGSPACPFIAYEDERDERSSEPDHAHRCYAEVRPAPRALAHQEAYCLSSAFPVCPTFQAWARREAAQARSAASASAAAGSAASTAGNAGPAPEEPIAEPVPPASARVTDVSPSRSDDPDAERAADIEPPGDTDESPARRNPPRDWAAPPPWAAGAAGASAARRSSSEDPPDFLAGRSPEGQGLAGSAADRLATGAPLVEDPRPLPRAVPSSAPAAPADPELAGLVGGAAAVDRYGSEPAIPPTRPGNRPAVSSTRDKPVDRTPVQTGPSWEKARRYEAYPTIKTRTGMPDIPRVVLLAGALGIAALALFFLPALLGMGGDGNGGPSASPSASIAVATPSPSLTPPPAPTPQVYVVVSGDTFTKIANKFGLTVEQLKAANPDIKDINKIAVGDEIIIPAAAPDEVVDPSAEPSP